ncbi:MAG: amino acid--tRNA ligase-related protein, partial [Acidobacteriota bacterium]
MNIEPLGTLARTHTCGELRAGDVGREVVLLGWVHRVRDLGSLVFIDLRDRHGVTQVVARADEALIADAKRLRSEYVVAVMGRVEDRAAETVNPKIASGGIEVTATGFRLLNEAKTPPFMIADEIEVTEETRLKHRFIDLRRPRMQRNMIMRHRATMAIRQYFDEQGFLEIETPMLAKSTPEGARDYL